MNYLVEAAVDTGVFENGSNVQQCCVPVIVQSVSADLKSIEDLLPGLIDLSKQGKAPAMTLMYSINRNDPEALGNPTARVYDNFSTPPGQVMSVLYAIKNVQLALLDSKYRHLRPLSRPVEKNPNEIFHVKAESLRGALNAALEIYGYSDELHLISESMSIVDLKR